MNVNLNSRADLNALNKLMADASIPNDVQVEGKKVEDHSLRITVGASGVAAVSVPSNRPTIDGVDGDPQVSLADLEEMVENISKALGGEQPSVGKGPANPPRLGKGPANPPRLGKGPANPPAPSPSNALDMAFNLFAVIDILQKAGIAFKNAAKEVNRLEHDHKRGLIEQEAKQIEKNGLSASASSRNSALLGIASSIGSAALTTVGTIYQMGAFKQSGVDTLDKPIAENEGLLKDFQKIKGSGSLDDLAVKPPEIKPPEIKPPEIKQQQDVNKEGLGKPPVKDGGIELQDIKPEVKPEVEVKENPEVKQPEVEKKSEVGGDGLTETERKENLDLSSEKGKVDAAKADFDNCRKEVVECTVKKVDAERKLMEARQTNDPEAIKSAQDAFNARQAELDVANSNLDKSADAHIKTGREFKAKFDDVIAAQKSRIADAKKAPNADAGKIKVMEDRLGRLQSARDGSCKQIGDQVKDTLGHKIDKLRSLRQDRMNNASGSKDFTTGKTWEAFAGIEKALGDSIGGFFRMESEAADGKGKSTARLIQRDEEQVDTARDATKAMQKGADELLDLLRDLRQTVTRLDHETAQAIFR